MFIGFNSGVLTSCGEGGVGDFYGEDLASQDKNVTPWRTSVAW